MYTDWPSVSRRCTPVKAVEGISLGVHSDLAYTDVFPHVVRRSGDSVQGFGVHRTIWDWTTRAEVGSVIDMSKGAHLRGLIQQRVDEGWSLRRIARQGGMSASTLVKLMNRPRETAPRDAVLDKIARGLQMPVRVIYEAANKDWTTPPELLKETAGDGSIIVIASQLRELPEQDLQTIRDLTDTLYRRMKEQEQRRASQ